MNLKNTIAAGILASVALLAAVPANAHGASLNVTIGNAGIELTHGWRDDGRRGYTLSPWQVRRILRSQGYHAVRYLDRQGRVYVARAQDYRGRQVVVRVSARSGAIISVQRVGYHHDRPRCWLPEGCS